MASIKDWASKALLGYTQADITRQMGSLVNQNMFSFLGQDIQITIDSDFDFIRNGYMSVPYMFEAVNMIRNKICASPPIIYEVRNPQKLKEYENIKWSSNPSDIAKAKILKEEALVEVQEDKIKRLLNNPNDKQSWDEYIGLLSTLLLSTGNALCYGVSSDGRSQKKTEIWALPFQPLDYAIVSGGIFEPVKNYTITASMGFEHPFPAKDIYHFKTVNPLWQTSASQLYGMAPMEPYKYKLNRNKAIEESTTKLISNGFRMSFVSPRNPEYAWGADQLKGMKEAIVKSLSSREAFMRFLPVTEAVDVKPVGMDSTEMGLGDQEKRDREGVYRGYSIDPLFASTDNSTFNNKREARKSFIHDAVAPWCELISDGLTKFICEPYEKTDGKKYIIKLDYMSLPEMGADMKEMVDWLNNAPVTPNEFRSMIGFSEVKQEGSDKILVNRNKVGLDQASNGTVTGSGNTGNNEGAN